MTLPDLLKIGCSNADLNLTTKLVDCDRECMSTKLNRLNKLQSLLVANLTLPQVQVSQNICFFSLGFRILLGGLYNDSRRVASRYIVNGYENLSIWTFTKYFHDLVCLRCQLLSQTQSCKDLHICGTFIMVPSKDDMFSFCVELLFFRGEIERTSVWPLWIVEYLKKYQIKFQHCDSATARLLSRIAIIHKRHTKFPPLSKSSVLRGTP